MIKISINKEIFDFDEKILNMSTYLRFQNEQKEYNEEPLPLLLTNSKYSNQTLELFKKWFKLVCDNYCLYNLKSKIFNVDFFKNLTYEELIDAFDFAVLNQFEILSLTIAKALDRKFKFYEIDNKYYYEISDIKKMYVRNGKLVKEKQVKEIPHFVYNVIKQSRKEYDDCYCKENDFNYVVDKLFVDSYCKENRDKNTIKENIDKYKIKEYRHEYEFTLNELRKIYNYWLNTPIEEVDFEELASFNDFIESLDETDASRGFLKRCHFCDIDDNNVEVRVSGYTNPRYFTYTFENLIHLLLGRHNNDNYFWKISSTPDLSELIDFSFDSSLDSSD